MSYFIHSDAYLSLLQDLEEMIMVWQKSMREKTRDRKFNARHTLAEQLGYKDAKILYRWLDPNDAANFKLGIKDVEKICRIIGDVTPLANYIESLQKDIR